MVSSPYFLLYFFIIKKLSFPEFPEVGAFTLHNINLTKFFIIKGFRAYFLAVCEKKAVYNNSSPRNVDISAFPFSGILKIPQISQSLRVPFLAIFSYELHIQ